MAIQDTIHKIIRCAAGDYWVGDPCYAFTFNNYETWLPLLESADFRNQHLLDANANGYRFAASGTAWGDGSYPDQEGFYYPVDAGLIGCTPARKGEPVPSGMRLVTFPHPFTVSYEKEGGVIKIGHLRITTDGHENGFEDDGECWQCGLSTDGDGDVCWDCAQEDLV